MKDVFKKLLSMLESSGGQNLNHPEMKSGMHKGTKAIGEYGMMPITMQDIAKENINKNIDTPVDDIISNIDPRMVEEVLKDNPHKYQEYVNKMADKVLTRSGGNIESAAMRWLAGQNSSSDRMNKVIADNPQRVKAMEDYFSKMGGSSQPRQFSDELADIGVKKDVIFNKIKDRLGKP